MERKIVELSINELELPIRGPVNGRGEDINIFRFTLGHPIEGVPGIETSESIGVTEPIPDDWSGDGADPVLFKTAIRGKSRLTVEACAVDKASPGADRIRKFFKNLVGGYFGVWSESFSSDYAGVTTSVTGNSIADLITKDDRVYILGVGSCEIDGERLKEQHKIDLTVRKEVIYRLNGRLKIAENQRNIVKEIVSKEEAKGKRVAYKNGKVTLKPFYKNGQAKITTKCLG